MTITAEHVRATLGAYLDQYPEDKTRLAGLVDLLGRAGVLHHPVALEPAVEEPGLIPYGSPDARRTAATRQVVSPHEVEPVGPAELPAPR
ncbi:hypothetical protein [Streptomyces pini]|uniref:Uncharacterized protein n=1 Tax=Streptomyces pini TaxID=1520580 RepID=A0A1I3TT88_9ACTN|nr:hypothetical protein [Streptomyces pini]SFJ73549.1 hypothetical protein SAMN05192584_10155 [Streptomyces pini]